MADKRKTVTFFPGIPAEGLTPEERKSMKENAPDLLASYEQYEKAEAKKAAAKEAEAAGGGGDASATATTSATGTLAAAKTEADKASGQKK